jgi:4-amino-4-deoxy-L-arabinose transferase-like glycosyltransferase
MYKQGNWITPTLEGKPWLEKPPLYYWLTIPMYAVFGVSEKAARIGPAVCALTAGLAIFWLGATLWSRLAGVLGAAILLTSFGFAGFGRSASTDMPFTCFFTLAMAVLAAATEKSIGPKVLGAYVFLGLAILGKGPVAIILAIGIVIIFWLLTELSGTLRRFHIVPGLMLSMAVSVPWFWLAFKQNGFAFIATFFINHNLARFVTDIHHHSQPFYYYLPVLLALIFPWSGWLILAAQSPIGVLRRWREWHPSAVFLACWFLIPILFFSISDSKLAGYILPSFPPLALILGIRLSKCIENGAQPKKIRIAMILQLILSAAMAIGAVAYFYKEYGGNWKLGLLIGIAIGLPAIFAFGFKGNCKRAFIATGLQGLIILLTVTQFAIPVLGEYHSTRNIANQALKLQKPEEPITTYRFFHHSLHYYTGYTIAGNLADFGAMHQFAQTHPSTLVVTKSDGLRDLTGSKDFAIELLGKQGNFRLLRLSLRKF